MSGTVTITEAERRFAALAPGLTAALSFSATDIFSKLVFASGMDVVSMVTARGILVVGFFWCWLRLAPPLRRHSRRARLIAIALGVLFAFNMFALLEAIALLPVSMAILVYFIYPLITGIAAAATGMERLSWRAFVAALAAFLGLALMLAPGFGDLMPLGLILAFVAALSSYVTAGHPRLSRRHRCAADHVVRDAAISRYFHCDFVADPHLECTGDDDRLGWFYHCQYYQHFLGADDLCFHWPHRRLPHGVHHGIQPLLTTVASIVWLGETLSPAQAVGASVMLVSLCAFQLWR